jgi:hypothetical protein
MEIYSYSMNKREISNLLKFIFFHRVCERVRRTGYYVSPNYGLIMEKECGKSDFEKMKGPVLAHIRYSDGKVVIPNMIDLNDQKNKDLSDSEKEEIIKKRDKLSKLGKILSENRILPREKSF